MASSTSSPSSTFFFLVLLSSTFSALIQFSNGRCFKSIFNFGDSLSDTGNLVHLKPPEELSVNLPPNGQTYFGRPTGRCSDGRLVIDFIAQHLGLPLLQPYATASRNKSENYEKFQKGVNFAVAGALVMDKEFMKERGLNILAGTNVTLGTQISWFKEILPSICRSPSECKKLLQNALFVMGQTGGSDYGALLLQGRSAEHARQLVPGIINIISAAIEEVIKMGAETIMVPGNLPLGCSPVYLDRFKSRNLEDYDPEIGCLIRINELVKYHNELIQKALITIQKLHPQANITYVDQYNSTMAIFRDPIRYGFTGPILKACCVNKGPKVFIVPDPCGGPLSSACDNSSSYFSWDGLHPTEAANSWLSKGILEGAIPAINTSCLSSPVAGGA